LYFLTPGFFPPPALFYFQQALRYLLKREAFQVCLKTNKPIKSEKRKCQAPIHCFSNLVANSLSEFPDYIATEAI